MRRTRKQHLLAAALVCSLASTSAQAQQVPIPTSAAQVPGPASGTAMTREYVRMVGRMAYLCTESLLARHQNKGLRYNADGSLTLYAGAKSPGKDKESNWLPAPNGKFSLYIRAYWAEKAILDGTWAPPNVEKVK